jgi:cellobiose-specific phosphotransferase system component IIC
MLANSATLTTTLDGMAGEVLSIVMVIVVEQSRVSSTSMEASRKTDTEGLETVMLITALIAECLSVC